MAGPERALVTTASPEVADLLNFSAPTLERYADKQGYELIVDMPAADEVDAQDPYWRKIQLLHELLPRFDGGVVMLDADVMIIDNRRDINDDVKSGPAGAFQGLVMEHSHWGYGHNTGVWVMRQDEEAYRFLDDLETNPRPQEDGSPQVAVRLALGWEIQGHIGYNKVEEGGAEITRPAHPSKFLERTGLLPREWNPVGDAWFALVDQGLPVYALHLWGRKMPRKIEQMEKVQQLLQLYSDPAKVMREFALDLWE